MRKKYGDGADSIISYRDEAEKELSTLKHSDEKIDMLESRLREKEEELMNAATHLSEKRKQTAKDISKAVEKILKELALKRLDSELMSSPLRCLHRY